MQEYDAHVSLEESPRLKPKNDIPRPDSKKLRLQIISSVLFGLVGSAVLFGIMYFFMEKDMNLAARIILGLPIFCLAYIGYSQVLPILRAFAFQGNNWPYLLVDCTTDGGAVFTSCHHDGQRRM